MKANQAQEEADILMQSLDLREGLVNLSQAARDELLACVRVATTSRLTQSAVRAELMLVADEKEEKGDGASYKHQCPSCSKKFKRKWNMQRHHQKVHGGDRRFCCEFASCSAEFSDDEERMQHEVEAHGFNRNRKRAKVKSGMLMGVAHDDHFDLLLPTGVVLHLADNGLEARGAIAPKVVVTSSGGEHKCAQPGSCSDLACVATEDQVVGMPMLTEWDEFLL